MKMWLIFITELTLCSKDYANSHVFYIIVQEL